ncbi:MAG: Mechanosensitive channel MscK [Verrucomicrobiae bacterium]|nr:Mechanosensitive channel MscK [Verrucomicrobiae bacterium]
MKWTEIDEWLTSPMIKLGQTEVSIATLVWFIVSVLAVFVVSRFTRRFLRTRVLVRTKLDPGLQYLIARMAGYGVLALGLLVALQTAGLNLSSLTVLAGALGVGIGFGLQNIVSNFVSGLILMGERAIQIGDRVDVNGTLGRVTRIGARATSIQTNDNISIIVPNSEFIAHRVVNWSLQGDQRVRMRVPVGVAYNSEPRQVEKLLLAVAGTNPHVLKEPAPVVVFDGFGDSALNFELRVWTSDMTHRPGVFKSELYFAIWDKLKEAGVEIPFPQRDLHLQGPVKVELTKN